ncbi:MAG: hypothetical protein QM724_09460 [Flavobacteriales bacterium]
MRGWGLGLLLAIVLVACGTSDKDLCTRFYKPYPDYVSGRPSTLRNRMLGAAMAHYNQGDYKQAAEGFRAVVDLDEHDLTARLYLVSALLGAGEPYKAEMHLDRMETASDQSFRDQVEWYNALCWLCSGQLPRALQQARWIASKPAHTYHDEAVALADALSER